MDVFVIFSNIPTTITNRSGTAGECKYLDKYTMGFSPGLYHQTAKHSLVIKVCQRNQAERGGPDYPGFPSPNYPKNDPKY